MYPALAVVDALGEGAEVLWVGGEGGMEADLVRRHGLRLEMIPAAGLHGVGAAALPGNLWRLARGLPAARRTVRAFRPDVLLFTGGYVGVPVALAARGLPKLAFVPDIEPGLALRFISRSAQVVAVTTEESRRYYPASKHVVVSGYPVRRLLRESSPAEARQTLSLSAGLPVLLVFGGSRGARALNEVLWENLPALLPRTQVVHLTGALDYPRVADQRDALPLAIADRYRAFPYLHEHMGAALRAADLVVSRAGASTLGEYPALGLASVLVPYPHAWRYQDVNAAYLEARGAAVRVPEEALRTDFLPTVLNLLADPARREAMAIAARQLDRPQASQVIAAELRRLAGRKKAEHG